VLNNIPQSKNTPTTTTRRPAGALINMTEQVYATNTWLWNENVLQYSSILSVEPQTNNLEFEALVHFSGNGDNRAEHVKCLVLINNERVVIVRASDIFFMVSF
jgi:hypothetical protein